MTANAADEIVAAIRQWTESLPPGAAEIDIRKEDDGGALVSINPRRNPDAASLWIDVPSEGRNMTFGAGHDYRL